MADEALFKMYAHDRLNDRAVDELIGISKGVLADGKVTQPEAEFLEGWMTKNLEFIDNPIVSQLYSRIKEMLEDGVLDIEEQQELFILLCTFTGYKTPDTVYENLTSSLPLCSPPPEIIFENSVFCFTGKFAYGPRKECQATVIERGGKIAKGVTKKLDYLVVGFFGSDTWAHTPYGRKIEKAVDYREKFGGLSIINEDHWANYAFRG